jgi:hypothetical protein
VIKADKIRAKRAFQQAEERRRLDEQRARQLAANARLEAGRAARIGSIQALREVETAISSEKKAIRKLEEQLRAAGA